MGNGISRKAKLGALMAKRLDAALKKDTKKRHINNNWRVISKIRRSKMGITEEMLQNWAQAPSPDKSKHTHQMIREEIDRHLFNKTKAETFLQGSYRNSTNISSDSDVDIVALNGSMFYSNKNEMSAAFQQKHNAKYGSSSYDFQQYKNELFDVLVNKFGNENVSKGNKTIRIKGCTTRLNADVLPCFEYQDYYDENDMDKYNLGIGFPVYGRIICNFPKQHIEHSTDKNSVHYSGGYFNNMVRVSKSIRNHLIDNHFAIKDDVPSYYLECLIWNIPAEFFKNKNSWMERTKAIFEHLIKDLYEDKPEGRYLQANNIFFLFHNIFWDITKARTFVYNTLKQLE